MSSSNWPNLLGTPVNADNAVATVTLAAVPGKRIELVNIVVGFDAAPSSSKLLTVKKGTTVILQVPIAGAVPVVINAEGFMSDPSQAITVELAASGTGGNKGYVSVAAKPI